MLPRSLVIKPLPSNRRGLPLAVCGEAPASNANPLRTKGHFVRQVFSLLVLLASYFGFACGPVQADLTGVAVRYKNIQLHNCLTAFRAAKKFSLI